jgi:ADP-ribose pyrophosphatase YjhB (NUDIX family)
MSDVQFRMGDSMFLLRVAALARSEGRILLHRVLSEAFWSLPGGRVSIGEDLKAAIEREIFEESGFTVRAHRLAWVIENFWTGPKWPNPEPVDCHEIGFYFNVEPPKDMCRLSTFDGAEGGHPLEFRWFDVSEVRSLDLRPAILHDHLEEPDGPVLSLVSRDQ